MNEFPGHKFLILHAYGAANAGDGLLVEESVELLREVDPHASIDVLALYPESFRDIDANFINGSVKSIRGALSQVCALAKLSKYDLIAGVGGGYLRAGTLTEALKTVVAHGMQVVSASRTDTPAVYLPQSIGPLRFGARRALARALKRMDRVYVRDDRSLAEVREASPMRMPDLALLSRDYVTHSRAVPHPIPVLSARAVHGRTPSGVQHLAGALAQFDGYVQSRGAGNEDEHVMQALHPARMLERAEFLTSDGAKRIVIAVRLHAALMALNAGHWVIHLAYERKGFGAFSDLGLGGFVHNVNDFDVELVLAQITELQRSPVAREEYSKCVSEARKRLADTRSWVIGDIRSVLENGQDRSRDTE